MQPDPDTTKQRTQLAVGRQGLSDHHMRKRRTVRCTPATRAGQGSDQPRRSGQPRALSTLAQLAQFRVQDIAQLVHRTGHG